MTTKILRGIYFVSLLFVMSGGFNYGFSRFYMALPFSFAAGFLAFKHFQSHRLLIIAMVTSVAAIAINLKLDTSPYVFPILKDGAITILKDGFLRTFSDGSGSFTEKDHEEIGCDGCGEIKYTKLQKGETYPVLGVRIGHPDFSTKIDLITPIGTFSERDYLEEKSITTNKDVENKTIRKLSVLMCYPGLIIYLQSLFVTMKQHLFGMISIF